MRFKTDKIDHQFRNPYKKNIGGDATFNAVASSSSNPMNDWFYFQDGVVHSRYDFAGDLSVSAFGVADGSQPSGGGGVFVDGREINNIVAGNNIFFGGQDDTLIISSLGGSGGSGTDARITDNDISKWQTTSNNYISGVSVNNTDLEVSNHKVTLPNYPIVPTSLSSFINDAGYITNANLSNYALKSDLHYHTNKDTLDKITETDLSEWSEAAVNLKDYFYIKDGNLHTKYNFVGDKAISAFGYSGGDTPTPSGGGIIVSGTTIEEIESGDNINFAINGSKLTISSVGGGTGGNDPRISDIDISNWNKATLSAHSHTNKSILDKLTQAVIDNSHTHSNKTVLDQITSTNVSNWSDAYDWVVTNSNDITDAVDWYKESGETIDKAITDFNDWFYKDANNIVHSKYDFSGDKSISAFGVSSGGQGGSGDDSRISDNDIENWNSAAEQSHSHNNKSVLDNINQSVITNSHTHDNKSVLDNITQEDVDKWNNPSVTPDLSNYYTKAETDNNLKKYLPLSGGTLTGHLMLGNGNDTTFKKVETVRKVNNVAYGAAFYTNADGTASFFHKNYSSTNLSGAVNDAILSFDNKGLRFAKSENNRVTATEYHNVLTDENLSMDDISFLLKLKQYISFDENNNMIIKTNLIGEKGISCFDNNN